jgi:hypothetical protein
MSDCIFSQSAALTLLMFPSNNSDITTSNNEHTTALYRELSLKLLPKQRSVTFNPVLKCRSCGPVHSYLASGPIDLNLCDGVREFWNICQISNREVQSVFRLPNSSHSFFPTSTFLPRHSPVRLGRRRVHLLNFSPSIFPNSAFRLPTSINSQFRNPQSPLVFQYEGDRSVIYQGDLHHGSKTTGFN